MDIKALPKVELHCHLEACFQHQTLLEVAPSLGLAVPADEEAFRREWLITEPMADLETALAKLAQIQLVWGSPEIIERLSYEACEYAVEQGIRIFELRYAPSFIAERHPGLDFETIHRAILAGLDRARDLPIAIGLIGIIQKTLSDEDAESVADFIIENRASFVGLDFADRDIGFEMRRFAPLIDRVRSAGLHITIHSGEDDVPEAPQHVRMAIEELGAERIGHGIHIVKDPAVVEFAAASGVCFEVCPISNRLTSSVPSIAAHPIRRMIEAGVVVSINSDDPGIFGIDMCEEYRQLQIHQGFDEALFIRCNDVAAAHSFVPIDDVRRVWPREIPEL
jgi:adenosine deaminase